MVNRLNYIHIMEHYVGILKNIFRAPLVDIFYFELEKKAEIT